MEQAYTYMYRCVANYSAVPQSSTRFLDRNKNCMLWCWKNSVSSFLVVQCNSLQAPPHAYLQCHDPINKHSYTSICTVQCEEGFDLIGTNVTKCSSQGNWSHALPVCLGMTKCWYTYYIIWKLFFFTVLNVNHRLRSCLFLCLSFFKLRNVLQLVLLLMAPYHVLTQMVPSVLVLCAHQHVMRAFCWMGRPALSAPPWACGVQTFHLAWVKNTLKACSLMVQFALQQFFTKST